MSSASYSGSDTDDHQSLYRHSKRPNWGLAIIAWERGGKRGYQFEDGRIRVFKKGFYKLFDPVEPSGERAQKLVSELEKRLEASERRKARKERKKKKKKKRAPVWSFADQVAIFDHQYPKHFSDPAWVEGMRGVDASRRLKRHRQPAIDDARELLSPERLQEAVQSSEGVAALMQDLRELLDSTSLVTKTQLKPLRRVKGDDARKWLEELHEVLYGDVIFARRFDRFVNVLRGVDSRGPSWQLATVFPALVQPEEHVCVHPTAFRKQAAELVPEVDLPRRVSALTYSTARKIANTTKAALEDKGLNPADMVDIHDFVTSTLKPSAKKVLDKLDR